MAGGDMMAMINAIWPFILMGGIFYFMLWRPQKKEQQKRQNMLESLKKGDKIITIGGMYGTITNISEKKVTVEVAENVEINFVRSAISGFQDPSKNTGDK
jgi:preprotein translocase subunit YajC